MKGTYALLATLFKVLSNPDRLRILAFLNPKSHTFSEIMFGMDKNPAVVARHLSKLREFELVEKLPNNTYKATEIGTLALNATTKNIVNIVEQGIQIAKDHKLLSTD